MNFSTLAVFGLATAIGTVNPVHSQTRAAWEVRSLEHIDLWFHGLAVVGFQGFAPLPMYSSDYAEEVRALKESRGIYPTPLDSLSGIFRRGFENDSTFEILHFAPLYFASSNTPDMLDALRAAVGSERLTPGLEQFGASVIRSLMTSDREKSLILEFVNALETEWSLFYREYHSTSTEASQQIRTSTATYWNESVVPDIGYFLDSRQLQGGIILISPALGAEGRIFQGSSTNPIDNVIAVTLPGSGSARSIVSHLIREACFPMVSNLVAELGVARDRVIAERISSRTAVRCGELVLTDGKPALLEQYRRTFLQYAPNVNSSTTFESAFPADNRILRQIEQALGN